MIILNKKSFDKQYKKLDGKIQKKYKEKILLFIENKNNPVLNNHRLNGYDPERNSINITGDIRAHYEIVDVDTYLFVEIGTHSELYK